MNLNVKSLLNHTFSTCLILSLFVNAGCNNAPSEGVKPVDSTPKTTSDEKMTDEKKTEEKTDIAAAMAKLSEEDRKLAEEQGYCVVGDSPLGSMGTPVKIMIKDKPVFICCDHCKEKAEKDPDATLAKVEEMKKKTAAEKAAATPAKVEEPKKEEMKKEEPAKTEETKKEEPAKTEEPKKEETKKEEPAKTEEPKKEETK